MRRTSDENEVDALRAIHRSLAERGFPPSQREIAAACGWRSASDANHLLRVMEAKGLVRIAPGIPRGVQITDAGMIALTERV